MLFLPGIDLCDGPIPPPEESYRLCIVECDQMKRQLSTPTVKQVNEARLRKSDKNDKI